MSKIKLYKIDTMSNGTERFQSQLYIGKDTVDFIRNNTDGIMRNYRYGINGFDFYQYQEPFEIVTTLNEMSIQPL